MTFTVPGRGDFLVLGDYLSLNEAHTEYLHSGHAPGYILSVTWRTQKPQGHVITPPKTLKWKVKETPRSQIEQLLEELDEETETKPAQTKFIGCLTMART